jgi:hypothetical protein
MTRWIHCSILPDLERKTSTMLLYLFHKIEREGTPSDSFYDAQQWIRTQKQQQKRKQRPVSLMNTEANNIFGGAVLGFGG